jgi:hypothetical protein
MASIEQVKIRVLPDGRVSRSDAAAYLGLKEKTLRQWALDGRNLTVVKVAGRCFYRFGDLQALAGVKVGEAA